MRQGVPYLEVYRRPPRTQAWQPGEGGVGAHPGRVGRRGVEGVRGASPFPPKDQVRYLAMSPLTDRRGERSAGRGSHLFWREGAATVNTAVPFL
jgi:hypothetical protein